MVLMLLVYLHGIRVLSLARVIQATDINKVHVYIGEQAPRFIYTEVVSIRFKEVRHDISLSK